ncbi:hypothetical protein L1286_10220 [Pseudoalteromonas sp. SMS1]|uniref:hypothetical protein n=1 Tax=Pseudoalteromonas sp. SMS1 TaxID=2908894 RepID=UPI001F15B1EF|nr:hypothetical protein [Pseudoalteromonas sp. SMS1]MCF2857847.1 hypothetical protein [Pseudoalteromonas sp. SMS1]
MNQFKLILCFILTGCILSLVWWLANATTNTHKDNVLANEASPQAMKFPSTPSHAAIDLTPQSESHPQKNNGVRIEPTQLPTPRPQESVYIPPIASKEETPSQPVYDGDLDDHEAYNEFLLDQEHGLKRDYIAAVDKKVQRLSQLLQKGINAGLPQSQLNEAKEKIAALQVMQQHLEKELNAQN